MTIERFLYLIAYVPRWFGIALFVPMLLLCLRHEKYKMFWLRFLPCTAAYVAIPFVFSDFFVSSYLRVSWFSFSYIICLVLAAGIMRLCFRVKIINLIFYSSAAYAMQNTAFNLYNLVFASGRLVSSDFSLPAWAGALVGLACYAAVYSLGWLFFRRTETEFNNDKLRLCVTVISFVTVLVVYVLEMWLRSLWLLNLATNIYAVLANILLLVVQWCVFRESRHRMENMILAELLRQEGKQHKLSEQSINIIDIKFHDLKHRIDELKRGDDVDEIEKAVDTYDSFVKSGNDVLDIVLTQKSLICKAENINLRIIADGAALSFMKDTDISALFGNILNNAIEAVEKLEGGRMISLNVARRMGFVTIHEDNNCEGNLEFENGLPLSRSGDPYFHGYGTKSIKMIAEKYGGRVEMHCENKIFSLEIIIPDPVA